MGRAGVRVDDGERAARPRPRTGRAPPNRPAARPATTSSAPGASLVQWPEAVAGAGSAQVVQHVRPAPGPGVSAGSSASHPPHEVRRRPHHLRRGARRGLSEPCRGPAADAPRRQRPGRPRESTASPQGPPRAAPGARPGAAGTSALTTVTVPFPRRSSGAGGLRAERRVAAPLRRQRRACAGWSMAWVGGPAGAAVAPVPRGGIGSWRVAGSPVRVGCRAAAASPSPRAGWAVGCVGRRVGPRPGVPAADAARPRLRRAQRALARVGHPVRGRRGAGPGSRGAGAASGWLRPVAEVGQRA